jgi:hypothetical protein
MKRSSWLIASAALTVIVLSACESASVTNPRSAVGSSPSRAAGQTCTITLPAPVNRPLPAVREVAREINEAFANSTANCGIVAGIAGRFQQLVAALDLPFGEQNLNAACGIGTGLAKQLEALVAIGQLDPIVTHPPEASDNVVENMAFITSEFCRNAGR